MENREEKVFNDEFYQSIHNKKNSGKINLINEKSQTILNSGCFKTVGEFMGFITEDFDNYITSTELISGREPPMNKWKPFSTEGFIKNNLFLAATLGASINKKMTVIFLGLAGLWSGVRKSYTRWIKKLLQRFSPSFIIRIVASTPPIHS